MSESSDQGSALTGLAHVPAWVRFAILSLIGLLFLLSLFFLGLSFVDEEAQGWAQSAAVMAETSATGLMFLLILFFVERRRSTAALEDLTHRFLHRELPQALSKIKYQQPEFRTWRPETDDFEEMKTSTNVMTSYAKGTFRAFFIVTVKGGSIRMLVEFNIRRIGVDYFFESREGETIEEAVESIADTLKGAKSAGYIPASCREVTGRTEGKGAALGWQRSFSHTLHRNIPQDDIYSEAARQYYAQDISIMTKSLMAERGLIEF